MIAALRDSVQRFYLARLGPDARRPGWNDEHNGLIAQVRAGDVDAACATLAEHLRHTEEISLKEL